MSLSRSVAEVLREHVTLEIDGIDRMYLNVYVPALQRAGGVASFSGSISDAGLPPVRRRSPRVPHRTAAQ
jgi:hypothetical protein